MLGQTRSIHPRCFGRGRSVTAAARTNDLQSPFVPFVMAGPRPGIRRDRVPLLMAGTGPAMTV
jgi:hypothetical protein